MTFDISFFYRIFVIPLNYYRLIKRRIQKGLSLIEAAMVLALSAVVVAGVVAYYQSASDNQRTEATISLLTSLISVIHGTYNSQASYSGITTALIANTGELPASATKDSKIYTPGGSVVDIQQGSFQNRQATNYFTIQFGVSNNMCPILARLDLGSSFAGLGIGKTEDLNTHPLNVKDSETQCTLAARDQKTLDQVPMYYQFH